MIHLSIVSMMIQPILLSCILTGPAPKPELPALEATDALGPSCCLDHQNKPDSPLVQANYECNDLTAYGRKRCNTVYGGSVCRWFTGDRCIRHEARTCQRVPHYELHYGKYVDVGRCSGVCKKDTCHPTYKTRQDRKAYPFVLSCNCESCGADKSVSLVKVPTNKCSGNCNEQQNVVCEAGVADQYSSSNGPEPSSPSVALLSGMLSGCSAGVQSGFDIFIDNRCFGHTFSECFIQGECPLKSAKLRICMQAANVFLTNTDSLVLGINGGGLWGQGLPALSPSGTWNPGEQMCLDLDLSNLPGTGANILPAIQMSGHLDVMVQDDSAVDHLSLSLVYSKCQRCIPKFSTLSHLYTHSGVQDFTSAQDCDCVRVEECTRYPHEVTYYAGTQHEQVIDVGLCMGTCPSLYFQRCSPLYKKMDLQAPEGPRVISVIAECECRRLQWNPVGLIQELQVQAP
jgi:hypothetical protein